MELPSRLLSAAVDQIASLPGIGKKSALRLALHLLRRDADRVEAFTRAIDEMRTGVKPCSTCNSLSEGNSCAVCADPGREEACICVVEDLRDLLAIEGLGSYRGRYHVLGGLISPMDGVGPGDLAIQLLVDRLAKPKPQPPTVTSKSFSPCPPPWRARPQLFICSNSSIVRKSESPPSPVGWLWAMICNTPTRRHWISRFADVCLTKIIHHEDSGSSSRPIAME